MQKKNEKRIRLKQKVRAKIFGTKERPRLSVFRSNKHIYAELINDTLRRTVGAASDAKIKTGAKSERAKEVGTMIAKAAKDAKIESVIFDRNGFKYTGRIKLLADAARAAGLKF